MLFLDPIDLGKLEIRNVCFQALGADPGSPALGQFYLNTGSGTPKYWNGAAWVSIVAGTGTVTSVSAGNLAPLFTASVATATTTPALTFTLTNQNANVVFAGPAAGGAGAPTFRALVAADVPTLDALLAPVGPLSLNTQRITSLGAPSAATDAATKAYVDAAVQGVNWKPLARLATTAALPFGPAVYANGAAGVGATLTAAANGVLVVDGFAVGLGDVILVKDEATVANNGLYTVTTLGTASVPYVLTRHPDMDQGGANGGEFGGAMVPVGNDGLANKNSLWLMYTSGSITVGTSGVGFLQINGATDLIAGTGITISGNTVSVSATYAGQASIVTLGTITAGVWNGSTIDVAHGGTGATTAAAARANLGAVGRYSALIGDGAATAIAITQATHGLAANAQMTVAVYDAASGNHVQPDISINNANGTVTITFAVAPAANAYRVILMG